MTNHIDQSSLRVLFSKSVKTHPETQKFKENYTKNRYFYFISLTSSFKKKLSYDKKGCILMKNWENSRYYKKENILSNSIIQRTTITIFVAFSSVSFNGQYLRFHLASSWNWSDMKSFELLLLALGPTAGCQPSPNYLCCVFFRGYLMCAHH